MSIQTPSETKPIGIDWDYYKQATADFYGRPPSRSARDAEALMRVFFEARVQLGETSHLCSRKWLAELMEWEECQIPAALTYLRRKGVAFVSQNAYRRYNPRTKRYDYGASRWSLVPELIKSAEADQIVEACAGSEVAA